MKRSRRPEGWAGILGGLLLLAVGRAAPAADLTSAASGRQDVGLTIYNHDLSLVRERRKIPTQSGVFRLRYEDVTAGIEPSAVHLQPVGTGPLHLVEQNYEYDLISRAKLMEKYVGRELGYRTKEGTYGRAKLLAANEGYVYDLDGKIVFELPGEVVLDAIPEQLIATPTLVWTLDGKSSGEREVEVTYLSRGFSWRADYVLLLEPSESKAGLTGWVTLDNTSGGSFRNARLQLVAGDVNRVTPALQKEVMFTAEARAAVPSQFAQESFFEYHLYTLERRTDVMDRQQKQILFFDADGVTVSKGYTLRSMPYVLLSPGYRSGDAEPVEVTLQLKNSKDNGLGQPIPQGIVRVYKRDKEGAAQFLGENQVQHTPKDETLRFSVGRAFDVVSKRTQKDFNRVDEHTVEMAYEVELRNHKEEAVSVDVEESLSGDWKILESSQPHVKKDATTAVFTLAVPAGGKTVLTYRARVRT